MNENLEKQSPEYLTLCGWCGIPLGSANLIHQAMCVRCYKLLINANLTDEEIFGGKKFIDESSLSKVDNEDKE